MSPKLLITGANGQLGREIIKIASQQNISYVATDVSQLDITQIEEVLPLVRQLKPQAIINCAAYTAVDKAEIEPEQAHKINVDGTKNVASAARESGAYFVHISTDFVFDGSQSAPYTENNPTNPCNLYGRTKAEGEAAVQATGGKWAIVRTSWLYSAGDNNFVNTMIKLGRERTSLNVVFDQVGTPTSAVDLAEAIILMVERSLEQNNPVLGIYHYSNEGVCSWFDFAVKIMKLANIDCKVMPIRSAEYPTLARRPSFSVLDKSKIKTTLGIEIPHWEESLRKVIFEKIETQKI